MADLALAKAMGGVLLVAHWFGCLWGLQASLTEDDSKTFVAQVVPGGRCPGAGNSTHGAAGGESAADVNLRDCVDNWTLYLASLYWASCKRRGAPTRDRQNSGLR